MLLACGLAGVSLPALADGSFVEKGDLEEDKGNYDEAIVCYKRAAAEESINNVRALDRLFRIYSRLHRFEEAQQVLIELVAKTKSKSYKYSLAQVYRLSGNFYAAQRQYEEMISEDPGDQQSIIGVGECLEATGNYDAARDYYNRAAGIDGAYSSLARQKIARLKNASAVTTIDVDAEVGKWPKDRMPLKVYIHEPKDVPGYSSHLRGFVVQAIADWNAAGRGLVKMEITSKDPDGADMLVSWVERIPSALGVTRPQWAVDGKLHRAIILLSCNTDAAGKTLPPETPATRAMYEARDRMMREVSLHEFGHALGLDHSPRNDDIMANGVFGQNSADVPFARSLQAGDIERLVQLYQAPDTPAEKKLAALAAALNNAGGSKAAVKPGQQNPQAQNGGEFKSMLLTDSDPTRIAMRDVLFNLSAGNYTSCVDHLKKLIAENPSNAQAHYLMAVTLVKMRNFKDAERHYKQVLKIEPGGKLAELANTGLSKIRQ